MKHTSWLLLVCASLLNAQVVSFGVKGGGFFTDPAERIDQSGRYVVGPMVELGVSSRVALEANALYSRLGTTSSGGGLRGHSVEFPLLGKYYFVDKDSAIRPWASTGFAFRNIWFDDQESGRFSGNRHVSSTEPAVGAVVGGGVAFKMWVLKVSPEVRYTRWGGYNFPATNPNQVQALLGIQF